MVTRFEASGGGESEVISVDTEAITAILGSVDFAIKVSRGTYWAETRITNYINALFDIYEAASEEWDSSVTVASQYTAEVDNVPDPIDPIDTDDFDEIEVIEPESTSDEITSGNKEKMPSNTEGNGAIK